MDTKQYQYSICYEDVTFPPDHPDHPVSDEIKDLILKLLTKDPNQRLGSKNDSEEILDHDLFKKFNVEQVTNRKLRPAMKPHIKEILDVNTHYNTQEFKDKVIQAAG